MPEINYNLGYEENVYNNYFLKYILQATYNIVIVLSVLHLSTATLQEDCHVFILIVMLELTSFNMDTSSVVLRSHTSAELPQNLN